MSRLPGTFDRTARALHWTMAAMLLSMFFIGVAMVASVSARPWLLAIHRPLGIAILALAGWRLAHRLRHPPPALPAGLPGWQARAARASHWLLYASMLAMPLIGWAMLSAAGLPVILAEGLRLPPLLAPDPVLYAWLRDAHGWLARAFFALVLLHLSAALHHAWIRRDGVFAAMAGRRPPPSDAAG